MFLSLPARSSTTMQGTAIYRTIYHDYSSIPMGRANAVAGRAN